MARTIPRFRPERSKLLEEVLQKNKVPYERQLYVGHDLQTKKAHVDFGQIEKWFAVQAK